MRQLGWEASAADGEALLVEISAVERIQPGRVENPRPGLATNEQARLLLPDSGSHSNQLAVLALHKDDLLSSINY